MHDPKLDFCGGYLKFLSCDVDQKKFGGDTPYNIGHTADCSAKDKQGMTPLDHLSQGPEHEKLRALLTLYLEEQRKRQAIEACSETKAKIDELEKELSKLVGLNELKLQLRKWTKGVLLDERRRALGLRVGHRRPPHMAFLGNPGTDEAYLLVPMQKSDDKDYGLEALEEIMSVMDNGKIVVIFAR
ncbi:hypothetical protein L1987_46063 [Smallanthus sonchifolius]|uniref:Uncharacterized protein n=1 Tax=Smallanthus sonchifolius TaxID=185202 RepID=A0ACB9FYP8_9ASTR|nr:hypothetical protein L1987_46063 [Smallanthus sonchifolius]